MSNYRQLVLLCVKALSTFDPALDGVDSHLEEFLKSPECKFGDDADRVFVSEVFAGCVRYGRLIKVVVDGFYAKDGKTCLCADSNLYSVLAYLAMFRLEELGMGHFKRLVTSQHMGKMYKFLSFFVNESNLKGWIRDEWCKVYDQSFVQTVLMSPILRFQPELQEFVLELSEKVTKGTHPKRTSKPVTETKPFNLTKPRPRSVPTPERIPTLTVHKPVPRTTYIRPAEENDLAKASETNRKQAQMTLEEAERLQFSCATVKKSEKTLAIMEQIRAEREAKLQYNPLKPLPVPPSLHEARPVKLNAAAIFREGARVLKEEAEEEKRLTELEAGQRDASEFIRWQEEMKQKELAEKLAEIERKHLEGQLSYEDAIIARQNYVRVNREKVQLMKEESDELMRQYFVQREEEQREMRRLVEETMAGHQNTKEAKAKLQLMKQKIVQQVARESQELIARALEEAESEMRRKAELIQQIRAMESVPIIRTKFVDLTETADQGLLSEMSIAELRERLGLMKMAEAEEEEERRKDILAAKQAKDQLLSETLENISRHRAEQTRQSVFKQEQQRETFKRHHSDTKSKTLSDLQEKLQAKRKEREQLKQSTSGDTSRVSTGKRLSQERCAKPSLITSTSTDCIQENAVIATLLRQSTNRTPAT